MSNLVKRSYIPGAYTFGKNDPIELGDGPTDYSTDDEDEGDVHRKKKRHTIRPWDVIMQKTREQ